MPSQIEGTPTPAETFEDVIETEDGSVQYTGFVPEGGPTGDDVMLLPGTPVSDWTNRRLGKAISNGSEAGTHRSYVVNHNASGVSITESRIRELYPGISEAVLGLGIDTLRRAHEAIVVMDVYKTRTHLVGHSFGGMVAVAIALLRPDLVKSITLLNSAGLVPKRKVEDHKKIFTRDLFKQPLPLIASMLWTYFMNRNRKRETQSIADASIVQLLAAIGRSGVPVTIIYDKADAVFPPQEVEEELSKAGDPPPFAVERTEGAQHNGPVVNPGIYGKIVSQILARIDGQAA